MSAVTGAARVFSTLRAPSAGARRSLDSFERKNKIRAGTQLPLVEPSFARCQISRN